jgi:SAM-dependent MidA family methyltransferase
MLADVDVAMVETSPMLRAAQQRRLAGVAARIRWVERIDEALDGPVIILANELLDALPVNQFVMTPQGWRERLVGLDAGGKLIFGVARELAPQQLARAEQTMPPGTIIEVPSAGDWLIGAVAAHLARCGGVALFIDYGSAASGVGDTLQAARGHAFADPLADPGEADLTTHVDFARAARVARAAGARAWGVLDQAELLLRLGLAARAAALSATASPDQAAAIAAAAARLTDRSPRGMGALFKALAITHPDHVAPGFDADQAFDSPTSAGQ